MLCQTVRMLEDMIDDKNDDDSVNLFCSSSCVMAHKVQTVSASGMREYYRFWKYVDPAFISLFSGSFDLWFCFVLLCLFL